MASLKDIIVDFLVNVGVYTLNFILSIVQLVFLLRLLFQLFRASSKNAFCITIANLTNPIILPLRKYIPRTRFVDLSTLLAWVVVDIVKYVLIVYIKTSVMLSFLQVVFLVPSDLIMQITSIIFYAIIFYIILKWVASGINNVAMDTLRTLSEPALRVGRQIIPSSGGFDFSPIIVLFALKVIQYAITLYIPAGYFF